MIVGGAKVIYIFIKQNKQHGLVGIFFLQFLAQIYRVTPGKTLRLWTVIYLSQAPQHHGLEKFRHNLRCATVRASPSSQPRGSSRCLQPHWVQRGMAMKQHQGAATRAEPSSLDPSTHLLQLHVPLLPSHTPHCSTNTSTALSSKAREISAPLGTTITSSRNHIKIKQRNLCSSLQPGTLKSH